jgi:hypothetical protein
MSDTTTPVSTISPALDAELRWETSQHDIDKKPLRMIEHHTILLHNRHADRAGYFAAFDGLTTENGQEKMAEIQQYLADNPHLVEAARRSASSVTQVVDNARRFVARHERNRAVLTEWIDILSARYPDAADLIQVSAHL